MTKTNPHISSHSAPPAALYLVPTGISEADPASVFPASNISIVAGIRHFIVENIRTARRFLRSVIPDFDIDGSIFMELNRHTDPDIISSFLEPLRQGFPVGLMSEAGCPAVADPGSDVVAIVQREKLRAVPLVGPSSILMSLIASGFNGQGFAFHGYLPVDESDKTHMLRSLEKESEKRDMTQIFIETPYRNNKMVALMAQTLRPDTLMCVAADITSPDLESIITLPAMKWTHSRYDYSKRPAIFLIYRPALGKKRIRR